MGGDERGVAPFRAGVERDQALRGVDGALRVGPGSEVFGHTLQRARQQALVLGAVCVEPIGEGVGVDRKAVEQQVGGGLEHPLDVVGRQGLGHGIEQGPGAVAHRLHVDPGGGEPEHVGIGQHQLAAQVGVDFMPQAAQPASAQRFVGQRPQQRCQLQARDLAASLGQVGDQRQAVPELERCDHPIAPQRGVGVQLQFDGRCAGLGGHGGVSG